MLSRDSKQQTYVDQLLAIVQLLQQSPSSQQQMSVIQMFQKFHSMNSLLGNIIITNVNDINLLITKQIQCRRKNALQLMQEQGSTFEMYEIVERFCLNLVRKALIQKILQKQSLMQVFEFMGMLQTNYIFKRQLIWNKNDRNEMLRRKILNQLDWINYKPIAYENNNNIYYKCLNEILQLLSQSQDDINTYLYIIESVNFLQKFVSSINSTKLIQSIRKQLLKILKIVQGEQANREIQVAKYKCFDSLKNCLSSIIKQLENDTSIYRYEVVDLKRDIQHFFNQIGLILMTSQSVAGRLSGLRLLGIEKVDQNIYLEWIIKHNIIDIILKQTEKQAFVNNSDFIFELLLKNLNKYKEQLSKIFQFIRVSKPSLKKCMLRYLQKFYIPDQPYFHEQIITFLLYQDNFDLLTEQAFDVIAKYVNKISSGFNEQMLCKLVSLYLIVPGIHESKSAVQRCQTAIIDSLTKIIQKRVFGQLESQQKLTALYKIYNILINQQSFSKQKVTLFCSISDKIMSIYSFKQESKQKLADWLCSQARMLDESLKWITNLNRTNSTKSITKIQNIISDILSRISSQIKTKLVEDIQVLVLSVRSIKIFKRIISFGQNVQKLQQLFEKFIVKIYDVNQAPQPNTIKCLKHFLFTINGPNIQFQESGSNYFQTKLVASEIYGVNSLNACLMNASNAQVRDELAEFLSDIYTNYCSEIKQQGNMYLMNLFEEIVSNFQYQYCLSIKENNYSKILGVLALIKHLMMATQIFGVGDLKAHNSLITIHHVSIKIVSDLRVNNQQPFQKRLPANMTLMQVMNQACHHFKCDLLQVQLRDNEEPIPRRYNGLTLQQLNLDRKKLKIIALQINIGEKNKQSLTIQNSLSQKARKVITQIYYTFAVDGKMGKNEVIQFIKGVTLNNSYPGEEKIQNFIQQYDDDHDGNITLQNFLHFYYLMSFKKNGKSVWTNITNMGYRYDLKKISEDWGPVDQKIMFRYHLHNNLSIYDTLFCLSKSENEEVSQRGIEILFRLPSRSENLTKIKTNLDKSCLNSYQIQYYLIALQNDLKRGNSQQVQSIRQKFVFDGKASEIFAIMTTVFEKKGKNKNQKNCLSMCIKILRSICGILDICQQIFNQDNIQISNKLKLPYTQIFVQLAKQALKAQEIEQFQSCLALQLTLDLPKREQTDGINEALLGAFNNSLPIRQIACNFIYLVNRKGQDISFIFNQQVNQDSCDVWFQTLSKIVDYGSVDLEQILQKCNSHISNRKQTIKHIYDPVLSGNLFIYLSIARKKKQIIQFQKLVNFAENILSTQNRSLIYQIMAEVDPINSIIYVKELIKNSTIDPDKQISLKSQYVGLKNLGSTCYINSVLQMLFWIKKFRKYFLCLSSVANNEQQIETSQTIKQIKKIFTYLQSGFNKFYDITSFCNVYRTRQMLSIDVSRQEDAHQFYIHFLEIIEQYFLKLKKDDIFEGLMISKNIIQYVCKECQHKLSKQQAFRYVHLQVKGYDTLEQSLKKLVEPQQIHDYQCSGCNKKVEVTKHTKFSQLPQHLVLYLNRIDHDIVTGKEVKISSRLSFPQSINLSKFMVKQRQSIQAAEYRLKAVIIHSGTCSSGHYYLIVRINNKWFKFDDKIVTEYSLQKMQLEGYGGLEETHSDLMDQQTGSQNAYMLCYQKQGTSQLIHYQKYSKYPEMMELIKEQKKQIINQLKVCNDAAFKFNSMMWNKVKNAQMKIKSGQEFVDEAQKVNIYEHLFDLSAVMLKFLGKFWKLSNPSYIHQLGSEISSLFDIFPEKSYDFLSQISSLEVLHLLCMHSESDVNNVFKHVLAKSIHLFYSFYNIDLNDEEPVASHVREIIENLFTFLEDQRFYKNIYHTQPYLEFWKICLQCINPIEKYLSKSNFIMALIKMLSCDYNDIESNFEDIKFSEGNKLSKIQVLPTSISPVVANLLEIVVISKFNKIPNMHNEEYESQHNLKLIFSKQEISSLMNTQLYSNILKNDYDGQKCLGSVIARFCYKNELFSKQIAQIFLKGLKKYDQNKSIMMTMLQYISHYVAINDDLKIKRMKWVFGIPQLYMNNNLNFGFEENTQSNMYNYISTLYFSEFDKYKPILQLCVIQAKPYCQKQTTPTLFWFLINIMTNNQTLLELISAFPSPICNYDSYISWLSVYFQKLQAIEQRNFPTTKSQFIQQSKGIYQILVHKIQQQGKDFPLNKYIIGKNHNLNAKYERSYENYKLVLYQHETYVLENLPYHEQNFSIPTNFVYSPQATKFILNSDPVAQNPQQRSNRDDNLDSVRKTAYTLEVNTESSLKLTFKLTHFQEQLYLQNGKFFINFPYSEMDFQQVDISKMIIVEELNLNQIKWSNRKFSYVGQKKSSIVVPVIKISEPIVIADDTEKISCGACTYLNSLYNDRCQMCQTRFS